MESQAGKQGAEEWNKKAIKVKFLSKELESEYDKLKAANPELHKAITRAIEKLKLNRLAGRRIKDEQVSKRYLSLYGAQHFWKLDLNREWRLIYTLTGGGAEVRILAIILAWYTDHKQYQKEVYR